MVRRSAPTNLRERARVCRQTPRQSLKLFCRPGDYRNRAVISRVSVLVYSFVLVSRVVFPYSASFCLLRIRKSTRFVTNTLSLIRLCDLCALCGDHQSGAPRSYSITLVRERRIRARPSASCVSEAMMPSPTKPVMRSSNRPCATSCPDTASRTSITLS